MEKNVEKELENNFCVSFFAFLIGIFVDVFTSLLWFPFFVCLKAFFVVVDVETRPRTISEHWGIFDVQQRKKARAKIWLSW